MTLKSKFSVCGFDDVVASRSDYNGDGRPYPRTAVIRDVGDSLEIWDTTCWDGFNQIVPYKVASVCKGEMQPAAYEHLAITIAEEVAGVGVDPRHVLYLKRDRENLKKRLESYERTNRGIRLWWERSHPTIPFDISHITIEEEENG